MNKKAIIEYLSGKNYTKDQQEILDAIVDAKNEWDRARQYFDLVSEEKLVDYAIHMEDAARLRYVYLLQMAKNEGVVVDEEYMLWSANVI